MAQKPQGGNSNIGLIIGLVLFVVIGYFGWQAMQSDATPEPTAIEEPAGAT